MDLQYNTDKKPLAIPEYGRYVQKMVDHAVSIEDKAHRNNAARAIIRVMKTLNSRIKDEVEIIRLWDQLFIMSDFKLDVDFPYEKPDKGKLRECPTPLAYPLSTTKYRFYGNNIKKMINMAMEWKEDSWKKGLIYTIANHMKKCYLVWNKKEVTDELIVSHLEDISEGKLTINIEETPLSHSAVLLKYMKSNSPSSSKKKKQRQEKKQPKKK